MGQQFQGCNFSLAEKYLRNSRRLAKHGAKFGTGTCCLAANCSEPHRTTMLAFKTNNGHVGAKIGQAVDPAHAHLSHDQQRLYVVGPPAGDGHPLRKDATRIAVYQPGACPPAEWCGGTTIEFELLFESQLEGGFALADLDFTAIRTPAQPLCDKALRWLAAVELALNLVEAADRRGQYHYIGKNIEVVAQKLSATGHHFAAVAESESRFRRDTGYHGDVAEMPSDLVDRATDRALQGLLRTYVHHRGELSKLREEVRAADENLARAFKAVADNTSAEMIEIEASVAQVMGGVWAPTRNRRGGGCNVL